MISTRTRLSWWVPVLIVTVLTYHVARGGDQPRLVAQVGHKSGVRSIAISPDGAVILTGSYYDEDARLWETATGRELNTVVQGLSYLNASPDFPLPLAFASDGAVVSLSGVPLKILFTDAGTGKVARDVPLGRIDPPTAFSVSSCGKFLAVEINADTDARVDVVECSSRKTVGSIHVPFARGSSEPSQLGPGGKYWARLTGADEEALEVWETSTGRLLTSQPGIAAMAFSPKSDAAAFAGRDGVIRFWDFGAGRETGKPARTPGIDRPTRACVAYSPSGDTLASAYEDDRIRLWDVSSGAERRNFRDREGEATFRVRSMCFHPDGRSLLSLIEDYKKPIEEVQLWDIDRGAVIRSYAPRASEISDLTFGRDGKSLVLRAGSSDSQFWDLETGQARREPPEATRRALADHPEGRIEAVAGPGSTIEVREVGSGRLRATLNGPADGAAVSSLQFSPDGGRLAGIAGGKIALWDARGGPKGPRILGDRDAPYLGLSFQEDGKRITAVAKDGLEFWDVATGALTRRPAGPDSVWEHPVEFSPDRRRFVGGFGPIGRGGTQIGLFDLRTGERLAAEFGTTIPFGSVAFSPDVRSKLLAVGRGGALWDTESRKQVGGIGADVTILSFDPTGRFLVTTDRATTKFWSVADLLDPRQPEKRELCSMRSLPGGAWVVTDPEGRFDTNRLEMIEGLHWVVPDDPFHALSPEVFLRDYFEPRLLPRALAREAFRPVRPLTRINRVQPRVSIAVQAGAGLGEAVVTVEVRPGEGPNPRAGAPVGTKPAAHAVRLFRDGRLVGRWPEPRDADEARPEPDPNVPAQMDVWREANRVEPGPDGRATRTITVRLPHRAEPGPVEFTAYAFNEDRVKSETVRSTYTAPADPLPGKPRAYLIAMGVGASQEPAWNLAFAAADARLTLQALGDALEAHGGYDLVRVPLISEPGGPPGAAKADLKAVLRRLAGEGAGEPARAATPDDLVILSFSGHGYTVPGGDFFLVPSDVGAGHASAESALPRCISGAELSAWLRDVDAGGLALVVDACHSAAAVQQSDFKPAPLGGRGLGQLAYDKGMRVLAASQAGDVAIESARIGHGLLTYALIEDGLVRSQAAREGSTTLGGLLSYAAGRVPSLYSDVVSGRIGTAPRNVGAVKPKPGQLSAVQRPELFDYEKSKAEVLLGR